MRVSPPDYLRTTCTIDPLGSHRLLFTIWERKWNEPQMTRIDTDQRANEGKKSVPICVICGPKHTGLKEEKALAGFDSSGHSGIHIQSEVSTPFAPASLTP